MKKTISVLLIVLLLAVACMGFVACDEDDPAPVIKDTIYAYMERTTFSFGGFEVVDIGEYLGGEKENEAELAFVDDSLVRATTDRLQEVLEKHKDDLLTKYTSDRIETIINSSFPKKATTKQQYIPEGKWLSNKDFSNFAIGDLMDQGVDDMIHDVYALGEYNAVFVSASYHMDAPVGNVRGELNFYTAVKKGERIVCYVRTSIYHIAGNISEDLLKLATVEERHYIAEYVRAAHREIFTSWYEVNGNKI